jgi:uncharacterized membrane protein
MNQPIPNFPAECSANPNIRIVEPLRPLRWLCQGASDFAKQPGISMFYGLLVVLAGVVISYTVAQMPYLFTAATSGFLLVAPILATGLYALSCGYERGQCMTIRDTFRAWRNNPTGLAGFSVFALFAGTAWQVLSLVIMALLYKGDAMEPLALIVEVLRNPKHGALFVTYMIVGGVVAAMVFAFSVVSVPMLLHRRCELLEAMRFSIIAVTENPVPLALWATIIMVLCGLGFLSGFVGFIVVMPVLGHASWHAYRDLIAYEQIQGA